MDEAQLRETARGRFQNIVNLADVPAETWGDPSGRITVSSQEVAVAVASRELGFCVVTIEPGKRSCPFHFHHSEEELFYVLSGTATLRQGDEEGEERIELAPGDFASFPPGTGIAHQFINESDAPFVYLALSNRLKHDVAEYPDSDKILVRGPLRRMLRRTPTLEYFDGES